jgi:glutamate transport system substrate-binding protein
VKPRSKLVPLLAAVVMAAVSTVAGNALVPPADRYLSGTVKIGVNGKLPGWSAQAGKWVGYQGYEGFDVSLVQYLEETLHLDVELVAMDPSEREERLLSGDVDLVISNYSIDGVSATDQTKRRVDKLDFAGPYYLDEFGVLVDEDKRSKLRDEDIDTQIVGRLCASKGTNAVEYSRYQILILPQEQCLSRYSSESDLDVVGVATDVSILTAYAAAHGRESPRQDVQPVPHRKQRYGVAMRKDVPGLCAKISDVVHSFLGGAEVGPWFSAFDAHLGRVIAQRGEHHPEDIDRTLCS